MKPCKTTLERAYKEMEEWAHDELESISEMRRKGCCPCDLDEAREDLAEALEGMKRADGLWHKHYGQEAHVKHYSTPHEAAMALAAGH